MINADNLRDANPWHPMKDTVALKHLGKLSEEAAELIAAISRCVIQGIDELEPVTLKPNREWLEDELADVLCGIKLCVEHFNLDYNKMEIREAKKRKHLQSWHKMA